MSRTFLSALSVGLLASAGAPVVAFAQAPGASQAQSASAAQVNAQGLHESLHLTVTQEDAWRAYRRASAPDPEAASRHRSAMMMMPSLTTPRRIDLIAAEMQADLDAAKHKGDAVKAFYAVLTPDQQRTFDRQTLQTNGRPTDKLRQPSSQTLPKPTQ
jgi:protein CpxP